MWHSDSDFEVMVSADAEFIWRLGRRASGPNFWLWSWFDTAGADEGLEEPNIILAENCLAKGYIPPPGPTFARIEQKAARGYALSMTVQAKVLGRLGKFDQGIHMIEKVIERIYPTKNHSPVDKEDSILETGFLREPPWQTYAWLTECIGDHAATERIVEKAAVEYQDPHALKNYALIKKKEDDLVSYEECMSKAAMAGDREACRKLANFYYLTSHGRFPIRGEKERTIIMSILGRSLNRKDYKHLAHDWYNFAALSKDPVACYMTCLLRREVDTYALHIEPGGQPKNAFLSWAEADDRLRPLVAVLKARGGDKSYDPKVPVKLLDT